MVDPLPYHHQAEGEDLGDREERKQVSAWHHRQTLSSIPWVLLCNRFEALELEGEMSEDAVEGPTKRLPKVRRFIPCLKTASAKKERCGKRAAGSLAGAEELRTTFIVGAYNLLYPCNNNMKTCQTRLRCFLHKMIGG